MGSEPVRLFVGMLGQDATLLDRAAEALRAYFGPIGLTGPTVSWDHTDYYKPEMGSGLLRRFVFFDRLVARGDLPRVKVITEEVETELAGRRGDGISFRRVNIDPGYLGLSKVVLASHKDYAHRIYLAPGAFAEIVYRYRSGAFEPLETTYPDYRDPAVVRLFEGARNAYFEALKKAGCAPQPHPGRAARGKASGRKTAQP